MKTDDERHTQTRATEPQEHTHTHTHTHTHEHTFFDSGEGNVPVATALSAIVKYEAPDGPLRPWALCSHINWHENMFTSFTPDSLDAASPL